MDRSESRQMEKERERGSERMEEDIAALPLNCRSYVI